MHGKLTKKTRGIWRGIYQSIPPQKRALLHDDWLENHRFFFFMRRKSPIRDLADRTSFLPTNQRVVGTWGPCIFSWTPDMSPFSSKGSVSSNPSENNMLKSNLIISPDRDEHKHKTCLKPPSGKYGSSMSTIKYRIIVIYELFGTWEGIIPGFSWNGMVYCIVLILYHAISRIKVFSKRSTPKINSKIGGQNRK